MARTETKTERWVVTKKNERGLAIAWRSPDGRFTAHIPLDMDADYIVARDTTDELAEDAWKFEGGLGLRLAKAWAARCRAVQA